jgi:hypothetical protein
MPSINIKFLLSLKDDYTKYPTFIETGTYKGDTIFAMEKYFDKLYTIELSEKYYNNIINNNKNNKINFINGDSSKIFQTLLPTINDSAIFFLDGHWSSGDTAKGDKDCPLIEEIMSINSLFKNKAIIIIDDCRLFGTNINENWGEINQDKILNILKNRIIIYYYMDSRISKKDRLVIHIGN